MKFSCSTIELQKILQIVSRAISSQQALPILSNILITAENGKCTFSATDLEISIIALVQVSIEEEGSITVPAKAIVNFAQYNSDPTVTLEVVNTNQLKCTSLKAKTIISGENAKDFPTISNISTETEFVLPSMVFLDALQKVTFAAAKNTLRPVLSGVLFSIKEGTVTLVATDSYRLSECKISCKNSSLAMTCIIPVKVLEELKNAISVFTKNDKIDTSADKPENQKVPEVRIKISAQQVEFSIESVSFLSRLIEGKFPNYEQIIPKESKTVAAIQTQDLTSVVKRMHYFAKEMNNNITCTLNSDGVHLCTTQTQIGQDEATISSELTGDEVKIALSSLYLLDFLSHIRGDTIVMKVSDSMHPAVFNLPGNTEFLHLIMPLRLQ